ncbi:MAG TPA: MlaD family protein, partial [Kofleriaceae bacterium]|nr:MlaD family protein [Kofleriaceae bacterium]
MKPVTNFKLGLFALAALASFVVAALALGLHTRRAPSSEYHTLFDESVQGLDIGAPVKYRGVTIGDVARIEVANDRRLIDVTLAIDARADRRLDLASPPPALRAQLASQGLTGVKFVDLDLVDGARAAPTRPGYLASRHSLARRLEDQTEQLGDSLPAVLDDARATLHHLDVVLDDASRQRVIEHLVAALDEVRGAVAGARPLAPRLAAAIADARDAIATIRELATRLDG